MSLFYENGPNQCSPVVVYNKTKHDLYTWNYPAWPDGEPIFGTIINPSLYGGYLPNGYNESNYTRDIVHIPDFSGKSIRPRQYGVPQGSNNYVNFALATMGCLPANLNNATPEFIAQAQNIAFWTTGAPTGVLVSPRHVVICGHFLGTGPATFIFTFLLKNNTQIEIIADKVTRPNGSPLIVGDMHVYRLRQTLQPHIDLNLITIYADYIDTCDVETINYFNTKHQIYTSNMAISWRICGGERIVRGVTIPSNYGDADLGDVDIRFPVTTSALVAFEPFASDINQPSLAAIHVGDSGSPCFLYDKVSMKTIFIGLAFGGDLDYLLRDDLANTQNLFFMQQELGTYGYSLNRIDLSTVDFLKASDFTPQNSTIPEFTTEQVTEFDDVNIPPLYKYPYSSRIYNK